MTINPDFLQHWLNSSSNSVLTELIKTAPPSIHYELCLEKVRHDGLFLGFINKNMAKQNLIFTDEQYKELCRTAIKQNGLALVDVPEKFRDYAMCLDSVMKDAYAISAISDYQKSNLTETEYKNLCSVVMKAINGPMYTVTADQPILGAGGCKKVYPLDDGEHVYAVITPELSADGKKRIVEEEFRRATTVRNAGLLTQDYTLALVKLKTPSNYNGLQFVTLVMTNFAHLTEKQGIHIIDLKNTSPEAQRIINKVDDLNKMGDEIFSKINADIIALLANGLKLLQDSFNLAYIDDGKQPAHLRLFLSDFSDKYDILNEKPLCLLDADGDPATENIKYWVKVYLEAAYMEKFGKEKTRELIEKFSQKITDTVVEKLNAIPLAERRERFPEPYISEYTKSLNQIMQEREKLVTETKKFLDSPSEEVKADLVELYTWAKEQVGKNSITMLDCIFNILKESLKKDEMFDYVNKMLHHFPQFKPEIVKIFTEKSLQHTAQTIVVLRNHEGFLGAQKITEHQEPPTPRYTKNSDH